MLKIITLIIVLTGNITVWLRIKIEPDIEGKQVCFCSSMPLKKDHQYLQEDFSDLLYNLCSK